VVISRDIGLSLYPWGTV